MRIDLSCVTSAQAQLFGYPSSCYVGCRLHLPLGFAERGIYSQSYFPSFSWFFLYNIQEQRGQDIDFYSYVCTRSGEFCCCFLIRIYKDASTL